MSDASGAPPPGPNDPPSVPTQPPSAAPPPAPAGPPATDQSTSAMAIVALVLSFLPVLCINFVGVILGVIALVRIANPANKLKGKGLAIAAIVIGVVWLPILAAIAIPNFMKFQARAKQSEAKSNLKGMFTAAKSSWAESGRLGNTFESIGWESYGGDRYTYYYGNDRLEPDLAPAEQLPRGAEPYVRSEEGEFRVVAVGNIDSDATLDVWTIDDSNMMENVSNDVDD